MIKLRFKGVLIFLLLIFFTSTSINAVTPESISLDGFVKDYANVLSNQEIQQIELIARNLYETGKAEYFILIVDSLEGIGIEDYALRVVQGKLGQDDANNGLLLLISIQDKSYRFEVGRGLEPYLVDAYMGRIGRNYLVENFQAEQYGKGIIEASKIIKDTLLEGEEQIIRDAYSEDDFSIFEQIGSIIFLIIIVLFIFGGKGNRGNRFLGFMLASSLMRRGGRGGGGFGGFGGGGFGGGGAGGRW